MLMGNISTTKTKHNSEIKLEHETFIIKIGTTDRDRPLVVYIECKTLVTPNEECESYERNVNNIRRKLRDDFKQFVKDTDFCHGNYILDLQVATSGLRTGKKSYMTCEIVCRRKEMTPPFKAFVEGFKTQIKALLDTFKETIENNDFNTSKTK